MKNRNRLGKLGRFLLAFTLIFQAATFSYSQKSRPRYTQAQPSQNVDQIPVDTVISLRMDTYISSKSAHVGDKFTATVTTPVLVNGQEAIPAGATISGRVTQVVPAKRMNKSGMIALDFDEITLPNGLSTQIVGVLTSDDPETQKQIDDENRMSGGKGKDTAVFVGGSGVLGAILGGITGGGKGAAVGGAVGAGVGLASVLLSKGEDASVPAGTEFGLRLKQPLPLPNAANTYDPSSADNTNRNSQINPDNSYPKETGAETRAQASRDAGREPENSPRPGVQIANAPENGAARIPRGNSPANSEGQPTANNEGIEAPENEEEVPLSSAEMIRRAQKALHEEGYYEGAVDGVMTPRVEKSLKAYQKEHNLPQTGTIDLETAKSLRITGTARSSGNGVRTTSSSSRPQTNSSPSSSTGQTSVGRPTLPTTEADQTRPTAGDRTNQGTGEIGQGQPVTDGRLQGVSNSAAKLQRQAADLLAEYQKMIGVRLTGTGIEMADKVVYTDDDISLLYAFDSFANSTQLYTRLLTSMQSQQAIRSATLAMAREARKADKIFSTSSSRWVNSLNPRWDAIRQDVLKLMYTFNISTSELDY